MTPKEIEKELRLQYLALMEFDDNERAAIYKVAADIVANFSKTENALAANREASKLDLDQISELRAKIAELESARDEWIAGYHSLRQKMNDEAEEHRAHIKEYNEKFHEIKNILNDLAIENRELLSITHRMPIIPLTKE